MNRVIIILILTAGLLAACQEDTRSPLEVRLYNADKDAVGTATFKEQQDMVTVQIKVEGLDQGFHGVHIHEYPKCEGPDFQTAGNHLNPEGNEHGLMHPDGSHLGDMPNLEVEADGTADVEFELPGATLMDGKNSLLKEDGTSIVIHQSQDDGISQPGGNSGARVVCGIISLDEAENVQEPTDPTETDTKTKKEEE
ncbi:superoxide dismutase, Cu-Zn family [Gracilibacillus ureilyticus]|uniref:Superoxide dismutase [Cu-Zn] n=1 Tax=Gracilibacillus ureilyticus TaxID=531814 RepID=A0A1H9RYZ6_9BACI|nr:superoxide dismutase family protein [Gracilibacillus ureilyticus]SER77878.1 superoxide dismutase, Cu-Zn family [Gracilibacillus ureilyticus]